MTVSQLVLASKSEARRNLLEAAGVAVEAIAANIDEAAISEAMQSDGASPRDIADALAEAKARKISGKMRGKLVLGADQLLVDAQGAIYEKPASPEAAIAQLTRLSGSEHQLISAAVIARDGVPIWRQVEIAKMTMRKLSPAFIADYVAQEWDDIQHCVGCYQIEARGAQLFSVIKGDNFTIQGLPLLPLLGYLREQGLLPV
ncbi:MAG: nucleoside triphosphate pyrophosphatase [Parasphingorhabdus sp.]|nr:nucleoside triphosphate pyrophosphatase [Parasphingorhabdus sp.]